MMLSIKVLLAALLYITSNVTCQVDPIERLLDTDGLYIGFSANCYLYWLGDEGETKNAEFRCGESKGDPMKIIKISPGIYKIYSNGRVLMWRGSHSGVHNAEFRGGEAGDTFWIRAEADGLYTIGFSNCPLFWRGDDGNTKNAEFRCGKSATDKFWIKNDGCKMTAIEVVPSGNNARFDGEEIIGMVAGASCSGQSHTVNLLQTKSVEEEVGTSFSQTKSMNWQMSTAVSLETGFNIYGVESKVTVQQEFSVGGSVSYGTTRTRTGITGTANSAAMSTSYAGPGAAMIIGFRRRYVFDKRNMDAKVTVTCKNGRQFKYPTKINLQSKVFGHTYYESFTGKFSYGRCTPATKRCFGDSLYNSYASVKNAGEAFTNCFNNGVGYLDK